jgi:hypothetical protein
MTSIRSMADQYFDLTGESAYQGVSAGVHHFVDGSVRGDDAAREHMARLLDTARARTPDGYHWVQPDGTDRVMLADSNGTAVFSVHVTEHPWRGEE